jgi:predicted PhzF superfamily epimerase YddE/YHI9
MKIPFAQIDAFADRAFTGNPAAVMPLAAWLDDDVLQAIAQENNVSETAFIIPDASGTADYELRWHTPVAEVALCGHATLASGHYLLKADPARETVSFRTRDAGTLEVSRSGDGYDLALPAWGPTAKAMPEISVETEAMVRGLRPDLHALAKLGQIVAIVSAPGDNTDVVSRVFTPYFDIPEDPVTGSAHAVMVPYWAERLGRDTLTAYQASARGGHVGCRLSGDRVILTGQCLTVIEGVFSL